MAAPNQPLPTTNSINRHRGPFAPAIPICLTAILITTATCAAQSTPNNPTSKPTSQPQLPTATTQPAPTPTPTPPPTIETANHLLITGHYTEAIEQFRQLIETNPTDLQPLFGLIESYIQTGQHDLAQQTLDQNEARGRTSDRYQTYRAELLAETGQYEAAITHARQAIKLNTQNCRARLLLCRTLETTGHNDDALKQYEWFNRLVTTRLPTDAESLTAAGQGFYRYSVLVKHSDLTRRTRHVLNQMLQSAYVRLDNTYWPAIIATADLLREKYNLDEAKEDYQAALEINPNSAAAHTGLGWIALEYWNFEGVEKAALKALATNPRYRDALHLTAACKIVERHYTDAIDQCRQALAINPNDIDALALAASAMMAMNEDQQADRLIKQAEATNPHSARLHAIIAETLAGLRRFKEAEHHFKLAIQYEPSAAAPHIELGMAYMRWGYEEKARPQLDQAWKLDPFNERTKNTLDLLERLEAFDTLETDHFIIKYDKSRDHLLGPRFADYLESIYADVCGAYSADLPRKTIVELFPVHSEFGVRITGKPWIHTVGACTGWVIALDSPRNSTESRGAYNYPKVLRHEFTHTVTLAVTDNRIPHWFTEGLAVTQEGTPRTFDWMELLAEAIRSDRLFTLESIDWGFVRPRRRGDRILAYAQSEWMCDYLTETHGPEIITKMLKAYQQDKPQHDIFVDLTGLTPTQFDDRFREWATKQAGPWGFDLTKPESLEDAQKAAEQAPEDAAVQARLARAHLEQEEFDEAVQAARKSLDLQPDNNAPALEALLRSLPYLDRDRNDAAGIERLTDELVSLATRLTEADPKNRYALKTLAAICLDRKETDAAINWLIKLKETCPADSYTALNLGAIYFKLGQADKALPYLIDAAKTEMHNANLFYRIARIYDDQQQTDQAEQWYNRALEVSPFSKDIYASYAKLSMRTGQTAQAVTSYKTLCKLEPDNADYHSQCAFACHKLGDKPAARLYAAKAVELDKDSPAAVLITN